MEKKEEKLTIKQTHFCEQYVATQGDGPKSYRAAFDTTDMKATSVYQKTHWLLRKPKIKKHIDKLLKEAGKRARFDADKVLKEWVNIAVADPAELISVRKNCCRFCYGIGHNYCWTRNEIARAKAEAIQLKMELPDFSGGENFNATLPPLPECPNCFGEGIESVFVADTRSLKGNAKKLYAGVKKTSAGIQILMRNQDDAVRNIAKYLGMFDERLHSNKTSNDIPILSVVTNDPVKAADIYKKIMGTN